MTGAIGFCQKESMKVTKPKSSLVNAKKDSGSDSLMSERSLSKRQEQEEQQQQMQAYGKTIDKSIAIANYTIDEVKNEKDIGRLKDIALLYMAATTPAEYMGGGKGPTGVSE